MTKSVTGQALLKQVQKGDRILLVNPPVFETRYSWLRWNQPLDLLRIGAYLKSSKKCSVELFDFMLPNPKGRVQKKGLIGQERYKEVGDGDFAYTYPMWRFGKPFDALNDRLVERRAGNKRGEPTQVWITSLCSYWYASIHQLCTKLRLWLPDATLAVLGNYPRFMLDNAVDFCDADLIVRTPLKHADKGSSLKFYAAKRPPFVSVTLNPATAIPAIKEATELGVFRVAVFDAEDDICRDKGKPLREIVESTKNLHQHLRFHAISGLHPERVTPDLAKMFAERTFAELYFEQSEEELELDEAAYEQCRAYLLEAEIDLSDGNKTCGFVWIGRPDETLEGIVRRSFTVISTFGSVILKPYTAVLGTELYERHKDYLDDLPYADLSPHRFPFAEYNGITRNEYHDLYRMAAFLNEKVRNRSFDLLNGSMGAELLRNSLHREVWNLEASPLSIID